MAGQNIRREKELSEEISKDSSCLRAICRVFHKTVEMVVDNFVDKRCKCVIVTILHQIAQGLCN